MTDSLYRFFQRQARRARRTLRTATSPWRSLPHFIIIGAQRSGTTSLFAYLRNHPHIVPPVSKEVHYFDLHFHRGTPWYLAHFPTMRRLRQRAETLGGPALTGEASPYYLIYPHAPARIAGLLPQVKLIATLRNPVTRAYSHYHHEIQRGYETLSFAEALQAEEQRLAGEREKVLADGRYRSHSLWHSSYLAKGRYADQLPTWLGLFPRERFLILRHEDLAARREETLAQLCAFLEVPYLDSVPYVRQGQRSYPPLDPVTRQWLADYFRPHNQRLYELLGVDFGWDE